MAECRSCGKEIPEGNLYCNECETRMKADESYLDSLLSSVVANSAESPQERPVKKTTAEPVVSTFAAKEEPDGLVDDNFVIEELDASYDEPEMVSEFFDEISDNDMSDVDMSESYSDMPDIDMSESYSDMSDVDMSESYDDMPGMDMFADNNELTDIDMSVADNAIPEFDFSKTYAERPEEQYNIFRDTEESFLDDLFEHDAMEDTASEEQGASSEDELLADLLRTVDGATEYELDLDELHADAMEYEADFPTEASKETEEVVTQMEPEVTASVFESYDEALDAEAALMGAALAEEVLAAEEPLEEAVVPEDDLFGMLSAQEQEAVSVEEDPFAMLGLADADAGVEASFDAAETGDDIMDIWGLMGSDTAEPVKSSGAVDAFGDFPELFGEGEEYMNIPEMTAEDKEETVSEDAPKKKKKKSLFKRIFGNVREDLTEEEIEERKRKALEKFEEDELKAADEAARAKLNKEEQAKRKEEEAAQKQAEKEALARKKAEEKRLKAEQKKLLKDKKEQAKRALLAEIEENEGKINKFGASIIIIMFAAMLCMITIGTSYYNYKISIDKAQFDFDLQRYDDAYNDVYGLEIKEEDMELYDKIMTVQYVNVQLLSYMRYHSLDMDAEALDSLIKGLRRYEKFIQHGTELGVKEDLNYLKTQIVEQLDSVFGIDEATAYEMLALETQEEYSVQIYDIVSKKN